MENFPFANLVVFKKRIFLLIFFLWSIFSLAQAPPSIVGQLPTISPPSPTVAGLMKFEEISVNHYTGIPDVSIPLYSVESLSKDIKLDISLKYHPSSIAVEEVAGYTGLGWNLFAGGSVARTVKGMAPDEMSEPGVMGGIGILQDFIDPNGNNGINRYNQVLGLIGTNAAQDPVISNMIGEYGWGVAQKGMFDTQHDLWQYNFMGHTGRFYIKRDFTTGNLVPIKLDNDNSMMITLQYVQEPYNYEDHRYPLAFTGFTLYDDKGYKYVFSAAEITKEKNALAVAPYGTMLTDGGGPVNTPQLEYPSAFNITEIYDNNDKLLIKFSYSAAREIISRHTGSSNYITGPTSSLDIIQNATVPIYGLPAYSITSTITSDVMTQKLLLIDVVNKATINFGTLFGRLDSNLNQNSHDGPYLNSMNVKNKFGELIKQYDFTYDYAQLGQENIRLLLTSVVDKNTLNNGERQTYTLFYKDQYMQKAGTKDYWGYYSIRPDGNREPDRDACTANILEKMELPTGGNIQFHYGPNTYSFIGSEPVTDFSIDDPYEPILDMPVPSNGDITITPHPIIPSTDFFFIPYSPIPGGQFTIHAEGEQTMHTIDALGNKRENDGTGTSENFTMLPNVKYYIHYAVPSGTSGTPIGTIKCFNATRSRDAAIDDDQWLMGGGIRIDSISYYTEDATTQLHKVKKYNYQSFANPKISSGSLAFAKPVYKYKTGRSCYYQLINGGVGGGTSPNNAHFGVSYTTTTDHNSLAYIRTKGSDVGYKNVTVSETGNGKTEYTYTSPIDYPGDYVVSPPFRPMPDADYKRGLLLKVKQYNQKTVNGTVIYKPLAEETYTYPPEGQMNDQHEVIGHTWEPSYSWAASSYATYSLFDQSCHLHLLGTLEHDADSFLTYGTEDWVLFGWPQILAKTTKQYFYPEGEGSLLPKTVTSTETYKYDFTTKKLIESTNTSSSFEVTTTKYKYDTTPSTRNRIGAVKRIETFKNNVLIDTKEITYSNSDWGTINSSYLPKIISEAKGSNSLESKINIKKYDSFSNPLEASKENGINQCYIWGYNSSLPIAVIENIAYSTLISSSTLQLYINNAVTASNNNNLQALVDNLNSLREALPSSASIIAYTYKPLIGVTTMIDGRGQKMTYSYDGYGRLKEVRDSEGKLLSENEYHYKNQ